MFKCEKCQKSVGPAVSPVMVITKKREKVYPAKKGRDGVESRPGNGWEIVKEIRVCPACR